jgi:hypothetical protein
MPRASEQARGVTSEPPPPRRSLKVNSEVQYLTVLLQKTRKKDPGARTCVVPGYQGTDTGAELKS